MSEHEPVRPERFLSASELAEYAYCRRAWWLRAVQGVESAESSARFAAGRSAHRRHAVSLVVARWLAALAVLFLIVALVLALER